MKTIRYIFLALVLALFVGLLGCGPVIVSGGYNHQTPPWFYPHRVLNVRYVYFPDYLVYYDLTLGHYIYYESGTWLTVSMLPKRFDSVNFKHAKQVRVDGYYGDNIRDYHKNNYRTTKGRRNDVPDQPSGTRRTTR